jgi:hypothetical protein
MVASVKKQSLIEIYLINFNYKDIMTIHLLPTLASIANIIDMINPRLNLHHVRTAFIASHLANLVGFLRPSGVKPFSRLLFMMSAD